MSKIQYIRKHRAAFFETYKRLYGKIPWYSYLHDLDKIVMLCLGIPPHIVSKIHRFYSMHHVEGISGIAYRDMIVDWECARLTKEDKPLTAWQTMRTYYPHMHRKLMRYFKDGGLRLW